MISDENFEIMKKTFRFLMNECETIDRVFMVRGYDSKASLITEENFDEWMNDIRSAPFSRFVLETTRGNPTFIDFNIHSMAGDFEFQNSEIYTGSHLPMVVHDLIRAQEAKAKLENKTISISYDELSELFVFESEDGEISIPFSELAVIDLMERLKAWPNMVAKISIVRVAETFTDPAIITIEE